MELQGYNSYGHVYYLARIVESQGKRNSRPSFVAPIARKTPSCSGYSMLTPSYSSSTNITPTSIMFCNKKTPDRPMNLVKHQKKLCVATCKCQGTGQYEE